MMQLKCPSGLIGDTVNTFGVLETLAIKHGGLEVEIHPESAWFYELLPKELNITVVDHVDDSDPELDMSAAFNFSMKHNLYMAQCYHQLMGLYTPMQPIRPELVIPDIEVPIYDYVFAPFSRSTPEDQKWQHEKWNELAWYLTNSGQKVCLFGNSKYDKKNGHETQFYVDEYDRPMVEVLNILKKCRRGCVSINTGISHLCYATNTKNYLFNNQGTGWGVQPDAVSIETYIPNITVEEMLIFIKNN